MKMTLKGDELCHRQLNRSPHLVTSKIYQLLKVDVLEFYMDLHLIQVSSVQINLFPSHYSAHFFALAWAMESPHLTFNRYRFPEVEEDYSANAQ